MDNVLSQSSDKTNGLSHHGSTPWLSSQREIGSNAKEAVITDFTNARTLRELYEALDREENRKSFGRWLRQHRIESGILQREVAQLCGGMEAQSISRIESGIFRMSLKKMNQLFSPLAENDTWGWEWNEGGNFVLTGVNASAIFDARRLRGTRLGAWKEKDMKSEDPETVLLLAKWAKLGPSDRALLLGLALRLESTETQPNKTY